MSYDLTKFKSMTEQLGIELTDNQYEQFIKYYEMLIKWNEVMNLTAITEFDEVIVKHFVDSISLIKAIDITKKIEIIDIGTGAGFPGIPLKIAYPNLKITLLDSLNKRVGFLNEVINELELKDIEALHGRAEDYAKAGQLREKYDLCVSRAVANLATLSEYCLPYVKVGGKFISYKSEKLSEELAVAEKAIGILGGKINTQIEFVLPETEIYRTFMIIDKKKETPKKYPRKAGTPSKDPLK
ncbi:MAG: 16S rRNA (guanine(527)-N(7))-methyltransferase RsmG [Lachnospiraceae bacterium]|nr:16S rRNA (guanine(527)-N(7))-methyltransferase RsmG [Lachnospiraceae bacterium]